ncbi:MAG: DUF72 domain-containing protein [Candidatus Acidiferrales bacterium]
MGKVYAGTSGWAYPTWRPGFYPAKLGSDKFLSYYGTRLNSVEVNYTFRSLPTENLLNSWAASTPEGFQFAVKAHQMITHIKRLRNTRKLTASFFSLLRPLEKARKLGPVLFQLPPFLKCDLELLKDFLDELPIKRRVAIEFRHASWFNDDTYALLRRTGVALCLAESEKLVTPDVQTAKWYYLRLRRENYSVRSRSLIARRVRKLTKKGDVFAYFMHQERPDGAIHAERMLGSVRIA